MVTMQRARARGPPALRGALVGRRARGARPTPRRGRDQPEYEGGVQGSREELLGATEEYVPARRYGHVHLADGPGERGTRRICSTHAFRPMIFPMYVTLSFFVYTTPRSSPRFFFILCVL